MTTPKILHTIPIPESHERFKWKKLAESMRLGDHCTLNSKSEQQCLANALKAIGKTPRVNLKTLTVWRRL